MYCLNCGKKLEETASFCSACGYRITLEEYDQNNKGEEILPKITNKIKEDSENIALDATGINKGKEFINNYKSDGAFRYHAKKYGKKIRNYLLMGIVGICVLTVGVKVFDSYENKKHEQERQEKLTTFINSNFIINDYQFDSYTNNKFEVKSELASDCWWIKDQQIDVKNIKGMYTADLYGDLADIEINLEFICMPYEVLSLTQPNFKTIQSVISDLGIAYNEGTEGSPMYGSIIHHRTLIDEVEYAYDKNTNILKITGKNPSIGGKKINKKDLSELAILIVLENEIECRYLAIELKSVDIQ